MTSEHGNRTKSYDCIVVGAGPAGATVATLLADFGHRVLVLERCRFPRHHIGESLMPQTYWTFKRLGVLDKLQASNFPRKESVQFVSASGKESQPYFFTDRDPHESSITWQVRRDHFDKMMIDNASEHGVEVRQGVRVTKVLFEGDQAVGVRAVTEGNPEDIYAKVVVDATGMSTLVARQLKLRSPDPHFKNAAIYAYYKGAVLDEGRNSGATIIIHTPERRGWFWFIPLPGDLASVGVVASPSYLCTGRGDDPLATLEEEIESCPGIARRLVNAKRASQAFVTSDFSYQSRALSGDGWVIVGDAYCFLDPVYSAGVMLALKSGEFAADAIHEALEAGDVSARRLGSFAPRLTGGIQLIRKLVHAFYDESFSFGQFNKAHPECRDNLIRLLIGDVFNDEVGRLFDVMKDWVDFPPVPNLEGSSTCS